MGSKKIHLKTKMLIALIIVMVFVFSVGYMGYILGRRTTSPIAPTATLAGVLPQKDKSISLTPTSTISSETFVLPPANTPTAIVQETEVVTSPTPPVKRCEKTDEIEAVLNIVQAMYSHGMKERNSDKLQVALSFLEEATALGYVSPALAKIRKSILYAMDVMADTTYVDELDTWKGLLVDSQGIPLVQPIDMSIADGDLYVIDSGTLFHAPLPPSNLLRVSSRSIITMTAILTPTAQIGGFPVKEIIAVDAYNIQDGLYVLDKSNDIFFLNTITDSWELQRSQASNYTQPDPHFLNIATYDNRLYLLDTSRNQIWRHPPNEAGIAYLNSNLLWLQDQSSPNVTECIDLAVDGTVFTLDRQGEVTQYTPNLVWALDISAMGPSHIEGWMQRQVIPVALFTRPETPLFVADSGRRRIIAINKETGTFLRQWVFADNSEFDQLHDISVIGKTLYILAGNHLYAYQLKDISSSPQLDGALPEFANEERSIPTSLDLLSVYPNDPRVPDLLNRYHLRLPIPGTVLPRLFVFYPGARRAYRYGVHQGIDFYEQDEGVRMEIGTPVFAASDGVVIRADTDFQEMTVDELNTNLQIAHDQHITPPDILDKLGGRQVWIDHGGGLITKYLHLSGISEGIETGSQVTAGQIIGFVGLSGTPDGIEGNLSYPHLHFEIRFGENQRYYLGQWLTIDQTRRLLESLFDAKSSQ